MSPWFKIDTKGMDPVSAIQQFLESVLNLDQIGAVLAPLHLPMGHGVMPTLVTDVKQLQHADPLSPAFPLNSAKLVAKLTRKRMDYHLAAVLRPCEIRAVIELVKLNQANLDSVLMIGCDCLGAYTNADYKIYRENQGDDASLQFYRNRIFGKTAAKGIDLSPACQVCEHPVPIGADILIGLFGVGEQDHLFVEAKTPKGEEFLSRLDLAGVEKPDQREQVIEALLTDRKTKRDDMFAVTGQAVNSIEKLSQYLSACVNCYNCRVACPVCYCRECVFTTDVFDHESSQYLKWAERKGVLKMPTDTVFYHITRLAHMSTGCVGCGQCSNACPNDIELMELFRTISYKTQKAFEYEAGRSLEEAPPFSIFREDEFPEVIGVTN